MRTGNALAQRSGQDGFTYLLLLFLLAIGGAGLAMVGERVQTAVQREREAELRFRGEAIAAAIQRYVEQSPVGRPVLPNRLDDLLEDRRGPRVLHPLRQLYADPFTGKADWEPVYGLAPVKADGTADDAGKAGAADGALPMMQFTPAFPNAAAASAAASAPDATGSTTDAAPLRGIVGVRSRSPPRLFSLQWRQISGRPSRVIASDLRFIAVGQAAEGDVDASAGADAALPH